MPSPSAQQRLYEELLDTHGQKVADAFMAAVADLRANADLQACIVAIERGDLQAAIDALHLDAAAYNNLLDQIAQGYTANGQQTAQGLPSRTPDGTALVVRFDGRNPRAEAWLKQHGAELVTRTVDDQKQAIRNRLLAGMQKGENPRTTALEIVGRVNRVTGKREGGVLGLTAQQEAFARTAEAELRSGDPEQLRNYLARVRRDRRFDRTVAKAIREEAPLPSAAVGKIVGRYRDRLLALRGETIGRTEALAALNAAQFEALQQAVESGRIAASQIRRVWKSAGDLRVRNTHQTLNGETAGLEEAFRSPSGAQLRYPGDPTAPASERINCRCWTMPRVDWGANLR